MENHGAGNNGNALMSRMYVRIQGSENSSKTNIVNMLDNALALNRPPSYTTRYLGYALGVKSKYTKKTAISLLDGHHHSETLNNLLDGFITTFVMCYACHSPETKIVVNPTAVRLECAACGLYSDVDMEEKLAKYIHKKALRKGDISA